MAAKHSIHAAVFLSGLALASAFSVGPPPVTQSQSILVGSSIASGSFYAPATSRRRTLSAATSSTKVAERLGTNSNNKQEIFLLDEVDSIFDCVDKNGDGEITREELKSHLVDEMGYTKKYTNYLFESIDTDSNGSISREELRFAFYNFEALSMYMTFGMGGADITQRAAFKKLALQSAHKYYDMENDGFTAADESFDRLLLDDLADLIFEMIDTDQSGAISKDELKAHFDSVTEKLSKNARDRATREQAQEYVQTMFDTLDANQDGSICKDEIRVAFQKHDFKLLARTFGLKVYQTA
jgi:Ca2+-binding EF-hand superfamily protein